MVGGFVDAIGLEEDDPTRKLEDDEMADGAELAEPAEETTTELEPLGFGGNLVDTPEGTFGRCVVDGVDTMSLSSC